MDKPKLYRKRFIPEETIFLKDDEILFLDCELVVTKWEVLKKRTDFVRGYSCYFLKNGFKVSRMIDKAGDILYHYCDIIDVKYNVQNNTYIFEDLLIDVIIDKNDCVKVLDLGEIPHALEQGLINLEQAKKALKISDKLLSLIYAGQFNELTTYLDEYAQSSERILTNGYGN